MIQFSLLALISIFCCLRCVRSKNFFLSPPDASDNVYEPTYGEGWQLDVAWGGDAQEWSSQNLILWQHLDGNIFKPALIMEDGSQFYLVAWEVSPERYNFDISKGTKFHLQLCPDQNTTNPDCFNSKNFYVAGNRATTTISVFTWTDGQIITAKTLQSTLSLPSITTTSTTSATPTSSQATPSSDRPAPAQASAIGQPTTSAVSDSELSTGAKAGVGVGVVLGVAAIGVVAVSAWLLVRRRRKESQDGRDMYKYEPQMDHA